MLRVQHGNSTVATTGNAPSQNISMGVIPQSRNPLIAGSQISQSPSSTELHAMDTLPLRPTSNQQLTPPTMNIAPVIRAGDRIALEQHTATLDSSLTAIALGPARIGANFDVRLTVGSKRLHAIAISSGHARLAPQQDHDVFGAAQ